VKHKIGKILLLAVAFIIIVIFNYICFDGAKKATASIKAKDNSVTLEATITSSESYVEIDEGMEREYWHANVTYTYKGITYSEVHYESTERRPEIGKAVTVKIDPENPGELLPDATETVLSMILSPIFLTGVTIVLYFLVKCIAKWIAAICRMHSDRFAKTTAFVLVCGKLIGESFAFYNKHDSLVFAVFSLIAATALLFFVLRGNAMHMEKPEKQSL